MTAALLAFSHSFPIYKLTSKWSVDVPTFVPAVNSVEDPERELRLPRVLLKVQAYTSPVGQVPPLQKGEAVKVWAAPTVTVREEGLMDTEERAGTGVEMMVMVALASFVIPFRVALT
jgi:hypothetical protein